MRRRALKAAGGALPATPAAASRGSGLARLMAAFGLFLAASVVLHPGTLAAPFYGDDLSFLDQARDRSLWTILTAPDPLGNYFRPVSRQLLFWLVGRLSGESPLAFHLVSWTLWFAVLALLFVLVRRLAGVRAA